MGNRRTDTQKGKDKVQIQVKQKEQAKPERKKWHKINWATIESAYIHREDLPSLRELAVEFGIDEGIIFHKSSDEKWVIRREKHWLAVQIRVQQKVSKETADRMAENLLLIKGAKNLIAKQITSGQIKATLGDIDKLSRAELLLLGQADSRPDGGGSFEEFLRKLNADRRKAYRDSMGGGKVIDAPVTEVKQDDISQRPDKPDNG